MSNKLSQIPTSTTPALTDTVIGVQSPGVSPQDVQITWANIAALINKPTLTSIPYKFFAYKSTNGVTGAGSIIFDTKLYDTGSNYSTTTARYTIPVNGFYIFSSTVTLNYSSAGNAEGVFLQKNGSDYIGGVIVTTYASTFDEAYSLTSPPIQLTAGDYISIRDSDTGGATVKGGGGAGVVMQTFFGGYLLSIS